MTTTLSSIVAVMVFGLVISTQEQASKTPSPELVGELAKELNVTPQQAAGAAGALFGLAKSRMPEGDWSKVAQAVPGMDGLLEAAPKMDTGTAGGAAAAVAGQAAGAAGSAGAAFSKLGLKPEMVSTAIPVVTRYVNKVGGPAVGGLLASALK